MIPLPLTIREATSDDAERIAAVQVASWATTYAGIVAQEFIDSLSVDERAAAWARRLSGRLASPLATLVAHSRPGSVVGFVSGGAIREPHPGFDGELHAIYLLREAQRQRLGTRLVQAWAARASALGLRAAVVRVLAENPGRRFYERLGARCLKDGEVAIGGRPYQEVWYGWDDLGALAATRKSPLDRGLDG